jgi:drug/metabolite transporter (DMT)-like permease
MHGTHETAPLARVAHTRQTPGLRPAAFRYNPAVIWFALTVLSAFTFATADAFTKRWFSQSDPWEVVGVRFVWSGLMLAPWVVAQGWESPDPRFWIWLCTLAPLDLLVVWFYVRAITSAPLSHTLPWQSFSPVFSILTGYVLLGEAVTARGIGGVICVALGAWLLSTTGAGQGGVLAPLRFLWTERGPRDMLVVALIFSVTSVLGKGALAYMSGAHFGPFYALFLGLFSWIVIAARGGSILAVARREPRGTLVVAGAMAVMIAAHFLAIEHLTVAYMIAVKRTSMLFGILYGAWLFRETDLARNLLASAVMLGGVALILMP